MYCIHLYSRLQIAECSSSSKDLRNCVILSTSLFLWENKKLTSLRTEIGHKRHHFISMQTQTDSVLMKQSLTMQLNHSMNRTECNTIPILDNTLQYGKWQTRTGQNTNSKLFIKHAMSINHEHFCLKYSLNDLDKLRNAESNAGFNVTTCLWPPCERCGGPRHPRHPWSACQAVPWPCLEKNMRKIPPKYEKTYQEKDAVFKITKHTNWKTPQFCNSAQFHTISSTNWVDLANLHDTVLLRVCAPVKRKRAFAITLTQGCFNGISRGKPWLQDQDQHFVSFCCFVLTEPSSSIIFHFAASQKPRIYQTKRTLDFACLSVCWWSDSTGLCSFRKLLETGVWKGFTSQQGYHFSQGSVA